MDQTTTIIIVGGIVVALLVLILLLRGRKQRVDFSATPAVPPPAPAAKPAPAPEPEGQGVGDEMSAAVEDVIDQIVGIDAHPSGQPVPTGDDLTRLKGLGPKAAARLHELGVTSFAQIASWNEADVAAIDAELGAFKGRIVRDKWVEQARLLSAGEIESYEAQFGKLGG